MDSEYLKRTYFGKIEPFIGNPNIKVLTGIRRCGKSTITMMVKDTILKKDSSANIIEINFEKLEFFELKDHQKLYGFVKDNHKDAVSNYLFIDEIQNVSNWELAIESILTENICEIYLTGSNSEILSERLTNICGRFDFLNVQPLSLNECIYFCKSNGLDSNPDAVFDRYLRQGGFPFLWINNYPDSGAYSIIRDIHFISTAKDVIERYKIRNESILDRIILFLCDNIGNTTSVNNIYEALSKNIQVSKTTVYKYIEYLENAHFISKVNTYDLRGKKILDPAYKFYLTDLGMKHALLGYRKEDISKHLENIVFLEMKNRGYEVYVGQLNNKEIDFVGERAGEKIYVQVTYMLSSDETIEREFGNLKKIKDNFPKFVVGMDPLWKEEGQIEGIRYRDIVQFLTSDDW